MQTDTNRRTVLITGGAGGIGAGIAAQLAQQGYRVVLADLDVNQAASIAAALPGHDHCAVVMDVANEASVEQAFEQAEAAGPVDVLVHAAGVLLTTPGKPTLKFWESGLELWEACMRINARGSYLCAAAFVRRRLQHAVPHGRIVLFSSVVGQNGGAKNSFADYAASKGAVFGFMRAAARECAALGITVNAVAPGHIDTPMLRKNIPAGTPVDTSLIPLGRLGQPEDIAAVVSYIISPEASYITGATFDVNGGLRMQ